MLYFFSKIYVFAPQNYGAMQTLPRKIMDQWRLCPARSQSPRSLPHKIKETLFFAQQNYGAMQTLLCEIVETKFQGPKNIIKFNCLIFFSNYFCKTLLFPRSLQPFGQLFKEKIFCLTVPLSCLLASKVVFWKKSRFWKSNIGLPLLILFHFKGCNIQLVKKKKQQKNSINFSKFSRHTAIDKLRSHCSVEKSGRCRLIPKSMLPRASLFNKIELA